MPALAPPDHPRAPTSSHGHPRTTRLTVRQVRERLAAYKEEKQVELSKEEKAAQFLEAFNGRIAAREEEEMHAKYEKSLKRKERREEEEAVVSTADLTQEDEAAQQDMAAAGFEFAGFGGSKKNN